MAERPCRMCRQASFPLASFGYCYLCFSRFGSATQVALLAVAFHPHLTAAELKRFLGIESASLAQLLWDHVQKLRQEEQGDEVVLDDCRVHTRNSAVWLTVYLDQVGATRGVVMIAGEPVPVYVVEGTDFREWATSPHDALYFAHVGKRKGEQA